MENTVNNSINISNNQAGIGPGGNLLDLPGNCAGVFINGQNTGMCHSGSVQSVNHSGDSFGGTVVPRWITSPLEETRKGMSSSRDEAIKLINQANALNVEFARLH
jgi:hypothetical protein